MVSSSAPNAPQPAPSVGVAQPNRIEPSAKATSAEGGTSPMKNSYQRSEKKNPDGLLSRTQRDPKNMTAIQASGMTSDENGKYPASDPENAITINVKKVTIEPITRMASSQ